MRRRVLRGSSCGLLSWPWPWPFALSEAATAAAATAIFLFTARRPWLVPGLALVPSARLRAGARWRNRRDDDDDVDDVVDDDGDEEIKSLRCR